MLTVSRHTFFPLKFKLAALIAVCFTEDIFKVMHDGFEFVKRKRKRKAQFRFLSEESNIEASLRRKLSKAVEEFECSQTCYDILEGIDSIGKNSLTEILCYGIGNFSESKSSLHQLAVLIVLQKKFNSCVKLYDPVFSLSEVKLLEELKFEVLPENEEGKRKIDKPTLVFLPHCPKQLTNNFLWANWNTNLQNCILIGNSFNKIIEDNTKKVLQESANYIVKIQSKTKEITLKNNYHIENIFNDISIHYFPGVDTPGSFFEETSDKEPVYVSETELITKEIASLGLHG